MPQGGLQGGRLFGDQNERRAKYEMRMREMEARLRDNEQAWASAKAEGERRASPEKSRPNSNKPMEQEGNGPADRLFHMFRSHRSASPTRERATGPLRERGRPYVKPAVSPLQCRQQQRDDFNIANEHESGCNDQGLNRFKSTRHNMDTRPQTESVQLRLHRSPTRRTEHCQPYRTVPEQEADRWNIFNSNLPDGIRICDVPFPKDPEFIWRHNLNADEKKTAFKQLAMRWHPDKFQQKFGKRLCNKDRDDILIKVKELFETIQTAFKGSSLRV